MNIIRALQGPANAENLDYIRQFAREYTWDSVITDPEFAADAVASVLEDEVDTLDDECTGELRDCLIDSARAHQKHWSCEGDSDPDPCVEVDSDAPTKGTRHSGGRR